MKMAPTLPRFAWSAAPPEGVLAAFGRPCGGSDVTPTPLASLAPKGALFILGAARH